MQEVRWEGGEAEPVGEYTFFYKKKKGNENHELGYHHCFSTLL
jgi:hypothetical protein